jgi:hypothetical protein
VRNPAPEPSLREAISRRMRPGQQRPYAICHCAGRTVGRPRKSPVVALSFIELLDRLLKSGGQPYWKQADFEPYGDVEQFTRPT